MTAAMAAGSDLPSLGLVPGWLTTASHWWGQYGLVASLREHVIYTVVAVLVASLIALPIGLIIGHTGRGVFAVVGLANSIRAVPAFGLLLLFVVTITPKIHYKPAIKGVVERGGVGYLIAVMIVLVILAIPPVLTNTYAGVQNVDPAVRDAAKGMGMTGGQVLRQVEFPIALPLIMAGIRSAVLQVIATATIAAFVPFLGGLGYQIFNGLQSINDHELGYPRMIGGAVLVAALAVVADMVLLGVQRLVVSPGVSGRFQVKQLPALAQLSDAAEVTPTKS
ncbi:MAG: osmoprotectant transport system permease protein [Pseudonocardiales bacterium]|jgi:osmoprotectant transport system permease protein|nr:osmoprotectant transport system permease protein [Pseudonocardiales bacterium]